MNEHRRIELTEFVNDNLAWDCDPELIDDIVDLIETKSAEYALHIAGQAVKDENEFWVRRQFRINKQDL